MQLSTFRKNSNKLLGLLATIMILCWIFADVAEAQIYEMKWINIGDMHSYYSEAGIEPRRNPRQGLQWPFYEAPAYHFVRKTLWIACKDWTDTEGVKWDHKISHVGPRTMGEDEIFPVEFKLISKFPEPDVVVDELLSFLRPVFNQSIDEIDPDLPCDRMIYNKVNTLHGITYERNVMAWSQEYHDNYFIHEYVFTNTGNVDGDDEIELPNQTLEGVYVHFRTKYSTNGQSRALAGGMNWGRNQIHDRVGDGQKDYKNDPEYGVDFRARYTWSGWSNYFTDYNSLGGPIWLDNPDYIATGDSVGRLSCPGFIGLVTLHADKSATDKSDDTGQPSTTLAMDSGQLQTNNAWAIETMVQEYAHISSGHQFPTHFDMIVPPDPKYKSWRERAASQSIHANQGSNAGWVPAETYGPYNLKPGESIRIVFAEGIDGLCMDASVKIGKAYKRAKGDDTVLIDYNGESMNKNEWVMTGRDSIFQMFERALANYNSGFKIPQSPLPPKDFNIVSSGDRIVINWAPIDGATPSHGWELWRGRLRYGGAIEDDWKYELIAELPPGTTSYEDTGVIRGISYYYYIQAVGDVNNDPTGNTPTGVRLKSHRSFTQTYEPAFLRRQAGSTLDQLRIVPNPYNLGSDKFVRWPDVDDQIAFLDIPGMCTIKIFTERGDLVKEIKHTNGTGDEFWNLQTMANQMIVSGLYIAAITDDKTGETKFEKFVVIR